MDSRTRLCSLVLSCFMLGLVISSILLVSPATTAAQEPDPPVEKKDDGGEVKARVQQNPIAHFFDSIGIVFGIIFAAISIGAVALIIVLAMDLRMGEAVPPAFVDDFTGLVNKRQFKQAFELCRNDNSFLARVMTAGMARLQYGIEDARGAMLSMVDTVRSSKDNWITYLATIGTLGPLLGLVGTVSGMVGAFRELGASNTAPEAGKLAANISHALVVTLVGIAIAVPAIFFYSFFKNRLTNISMNTSNLADDLLTQMYHNSKKAGAQTGSAEARASTAVQPGTPA
ncbi:MAG: MotA/TolQ/ExbB proton channel family protein [Gemmataceae bacterium]|nr:MotA/TolQ/ExbB proton channel family protein [Gemmataceae bacterium]